MRLALLLVLLLGIGVAHGERAYERMPYIDLEPDPIDALMAAAVAAYPEHAGGVVALVSVPQQRLFLYEQGARSAAYAVSTSRYGVGSREGSEQTPLGAHRIKRKIGDGAPIGRIFRSRVDTGQEARIVEEPRATNQDYVTTRILWLDGLEPGFNQGGEVDSFKRYIYIHGTHEEGLIGQPASHGCVRMRNADVVEVFDRLPLDALVLITAEH